ncbi:MAG: nucleotide exchange factor GrpE [Anaerolineaceae bacterium]|nr:nucleotide exchange factor GrpE [Anaerolineaceae bacterium]
MTKKKKDKSEKSEEEIKAVEQSGEAMENDNESEEMAEEEPIAMTMLPVEDLKALQQELEDAHKKTAENLDGWQRERADFGNYKKRVERDKVQMRKDITGAVVKKYLDVMDDLARALKAKPEDENGKNWADGIELIYRKLQTILENEGVQKIEADDAIFDPNIHEAITHEDSPDHESGQIIEVLQQGYILGERVLRPSMVRVAK